MPAHGEVFDLAIFHDRRGFDRSKSERSVLFANAPELLRGVVLQVKLRLHSRCVRDCGRDRSASLQPGARRAVGQFRAVAKPGRIEVVATHFAGILNTQFDDQRKSVLSVQQRGQVRGKLARQHRKRRHAGIDRGALAGRSAVRRGSFGGRCVHVGNPHQQTDGAVREFFDVFDLVQVSRAVIVNRGPKQRTEVARLEFRL